VCLSPSGAGLAIVEGQVRLTLTLLALAAAAAAPAARAGDTACWLDQGVVVVPAEVLGVAGDYIFDTAAPTTLLGDTQAGGAGFAATSLAGQIRIAGLTLETRPVEVARLDLRTGLFPTPIAGVIGADLLKAYVVDVSVSPCRVSIRRPGRAPPFRARAVLPLRWIAGLPTVEASVSDGTRAWRGVFALATGADTAVRLSDAVAQAPGAGKPQELFPYGVLRPKLRALGFAGDLYEGLPAGLIKAPDPALAGQIGAPLLARYRLRFDFPRGRLLIAPAARPRPSGRRSARSGDSSHRAGR